MWGPALLDVFDRDGGIKRSLTRRLTTPSRWCDPHAGGQRCHPEEPGWTQGEGLCQHREVQQGQVQGPALVPENFLLEKRTPREDPTVAFQRLQGADGDPLSGSTVTGRGVTASSWSGARLDVRERPAVLVAVGPWRKTPRGAAVAPEPAEARREGPPAARPSGGGSLPRQGAQLEGL